MRKFHLFAIAVAVACSCDTKPEEEIPVVPPEPEVKEVSIIGDVYPYYWKSGDAISVNGTVSSPLEDVAQGSSRAVFKYTDIEAPYYAAYPASAVSDFSSGSAVVTIPSKQKWVPGSYDSAAFVMVGTSDNEVISFEPKVAILKIAVKGEAKIVSLSLTSLSGAPLSGRFTTDFSALTPSGDNGSCVTLHCQGGAPADSSWHVVIPASDLSVSGMSIVLTDSEGGSMKRKFVPEAAYNPGELYTISLNYSPDPSGGIADADALRAFLAAPSGDACLLEDIDLQGESVSAASFNGIFDGRGHTISNPGAPLFATNSGTIKNLTLEGAFEPSQDVFSPVVLKNEGTVERVVNRAGVSISRSSASTSSIVLGGIAAYSSGSIISCSNEGDISFASTSSVKGVGIGGIAGYLNAKAEGCTNSGKISFQASHPAGESAIGSISRAITSVGGIAGYGYTGFSANGCSNSGEVSFQFTSIERVTAESERHQIGGIAGSPCGGISNCVNDGNVTVCAVTTSHTAFSAINVLLDIGGICGGEFFSPGQNVTNILSCTNNGNISVDFDATDSNTAVGGIVGWPNLEASVNNRTEDCVNTGTITVYGNGKGRFAGIQAGTGRIINCRNEGDIIIEKTSSNSSAGGLCAFHSSGHSLTGSSTTGSIRTKVALLAQGGLIGVVSNQSMTIGEGCSVNCALESAASGHGRIGMVVGWYNGTSAKNSVGTSSNPISVEGTVTLGGNTVQITSANYTSWLSGTDNSTTNHTIHAFCNTSSEQSARVEGHVRYSDGSPAAGISVSNGFDVTVTDADGSYSLPDNDDVWYFYISLPSDAVISKNADGCPDFYKRKLAGCTVYDFTLERQAVEDNFLLFALADPQAHYTRYESQTIADVDRFISESVPAINSRIAASALPCYAVTLGDIVFSDGSRNSTNGLSVMRSHCSKINAPVFQTFGNHDYTFFSTSSGNDLKTDATSSTLYLKAQRSFEDCLGPINYSFNRGKVHVVCMRNVIWSSTTKNWEYDGGFTSGQYAWLKADLANVPSDRTVILCVHIPILSCLGGQNVGNVLSLLKGFAHSEIFSGHTHYGQNEPNVNGTGIYEHVHTSVCGTWWWSNVASDGSPNGYYVYELSGNDVTDSYFMGVNTGMNARDYQMRIYRGGLKYGGQYIYFQSPHTSDKLFINVFNADSSWKVEVYEDGVYAGDAVLMPENTEYRTDKKYSTVTFGEQSSQDWWASGYHLGVLGLGFDSNNKLKPYSWFMDCCFHMYKYTMKDPSASVKVVATDAFGNRYTCDEVMDQDCYYPDYMRLGNI